MVLKKNSWMFERLEKIVIKKFYQHSEMIEELCVLLRVPMLPKNGRLSAKDHPIINKRNDFE
jgi:hypothetical protein